VGVGSGRFIHKSNIINHKSNIINIKRGKTKYGKQHNNKRKKEKKEL